LLPLESCCHFDYAIIQILPRNLKITWNEPNELNGLAPFYQVELYYFDFNIQKFIIQTNTTTRFDHYSSNKNESILTQSNNELRLQFEGSIKNLLPYTYYSMFMEICNEDLVNKSKLYCLNGTGINNKQQQLTFYTPQSIPQYQPGPILKFFNSSLIQVGIGRPSKPNGIILLYEIWMKTVISDSFYKLACTSEEFYDPLNQIHNNQSDNLKYCTINQLKANTLYSLRATSSTILGRSNLSDSEIRVKTLEDKPKCAPILTEGYSNYFDKIYLKWFPSFQDTQTNDTLKHCIGGDLIHFQVILVQPNSTTNDTIIYSGIESSFIYENLKSSTIYNFKLSLCNSIGCAINSELFSIMTLKPPPIQWNKIQPKYERINSTFVRLNWTDYSIAYQIQFNNDFNNMGSSMGDIKYRLERLKISYAFPPVPVENGIRFHGFNYLYFPSSYYPGNSYFLLLFF
jgi:hypothetical protein